MRWRGRRQSANIEDRRGSGASARLGLPGRIGWGRGGRGAGLGGRGAGLGGLGLLVVLAILLFAGIDPRLLLQEVTTDDGEPGGQARIPPEQAELADFVAVVLADTEDTWNALFPEQLGLDYREPTLVLFSGAVDSACGFAQAASGPFYCPLDQKVYLDLEFFDELQRRFQAPGDFALAYVVAHEVGHHVQTLLGITREVQALRGRVNQSEYNALSVRLELQADCLAGLWAGHAQDSKAILEAGDLEEALNAAAAVGDDRIQRRNQGYVVPESFTHGSSAQRVRWFEQGLASDSPATCDTFASQSE